MNAGAYWLPIVRQMSREVVTPADLERFRRHPAHRHIDNGNEFSCGGDVAQLHRSCEEYWRIIKPLLSPEDYELANDSLRGGGRLLAVEPDILATRASIEYAYMTSRLEAFEPFRRVVEIGGGYGGLARAVLAKYPGVRYTLIDLPEVLDVQRFFLDDKLERVSFLEAGTDPQGVVDLFINTRSMMEMELDQVRWYFAMMENRLADEGGFYCVNRVAKVTRLTDYPWPEGWEQIDERTFPLQADIREISLVKKET